MRRIATLYVLWAVTTFGAGGCSHGIVGEAQPSVGFGSAGGDTDTGGGTATEGGTTTGGGSAGATAGDVASGGSVTGGGATGGGPAGGWPHGVFAPYVDATSDPILRLTQARDAAGVHHFVLGFVVAQAPTSCEPSWGTFYDLDSGPSSWDGGVEVSLYDEIASIRASGGEVMPVLGGPAGVPLAAACQSVVQTAAAYQTVMDALGVRWLDFYVVGSWTADADSIARRNQAIAQVQAQDPSIQVRFTLPVVPSGLTAEGVALVAAAVDAGVTITSVNLLTMNYGDGAAPNPDGKMGAYATMALSGVHEQLDQIYEDAGQSKDDGALWRMLGATPMIGRNDVATEVFTLSDAQVLTDWAQTQDLGSLGMWSANRDYPCPAEPSVRPDCSSAPDQTEELAFSQVFSAFGP